MQGERLEAAEVEPQGLRGDRAFALFDTETGLGLTARRVPQLLFAAAAYRNDGAVTITLPDGTTADDDRALSDWLGRPVTLRAAAEPGERVFENPADFEHDAVWEPFRGSTGAFHDSGKVHVSLLSLATIADWPRRRFRANVLLDGGGEDALVRSRVGLGDAELYVRSGSLAASWSPGRSPRASTGRSRRISMSSVRSTVNATAAWRSAPPSPRRAGSRSATSYND